MDDALRDRVVAELRSYSEFADFSDDDLLSISTMGVGQVTAFRIACRDVSSSFKDEAIALLQRLASFCRLD